MATPTAPRPEGERLSTSAPSPAARVAANAAWVTGAELIGKVASFVLVVVLARGLGAREYGYFNFGMAFIPLFLQFGRWGIDTAIVRAVTSDRDDEAAFSSAFVNGLALRSGLAVAGLALAMAASPLFVHGRRPLEAVVVIGFALLLDEFRTFFGAVFMAFEKMRFNALTMLVNRILSTTLAVVAVALGAGLVAVCVTYLLGSLASMITGWVAFVRFFPPVRRRDLRRSVMRALLKDGAAYGAASFLNMAAFRVDAVILEAMKGPVAVGIYGVAYRFFEPLLFVTWGLSSAAFPRLVQEHVRGVRTRTYGLTLAAIAAFYLPVLAGAPFLARYLIIVLFSARYDVAAPAAVWLTTSALFYGVAHLSRMSLVAIGRRSEIVWVAAAALTLNVVANVIVIPSHTYTGAAAATFATEVLEAVLLMWLYARYTGGLQGVRAMSVPLFASAVMAAVLAATGWRGGEALLAGGFVYAAGLLTFGMLISPELVRATGRGLRRLSRRVRS